MENFLLMLEEELEQQKALRKKSLRILKNAPSGTLHSRNRKEGKAFYVYEKKDLKGFERNITDDKHLIKLMVNKRMATEILSSAEENIKYIEKLKRHYACNSPDSVLRNLPLTYKEAALDISFHCTEKWAAKQTMQYGFDPDIHIHETISGVRVRSKSEMIIANTLTNYDVPFFYEKPFPYPTAQGTFYSPDFTFELPFGEIIIWEHLGLLNDLGYCERTALKLNLYQKHGFIIGKNLIITQDDEKGGCSSIFIDEVVRRHLLPHFRKA